MVDRVRAMRQLLPDAADVPDPFDLLAADERRPRAGRPWVMANMVTSLDGAYAVEGRSGQLSGPADREVFHALRALADIVLVAAGTAREERYRRPWPVPEAQDLRADRGQAPAPRLVVVSRRAHVPEDQPFLAGEGPDPLLVHPRSTDVSALPPGVEPRACGEDSVDLAALLVGLADDGAGLVLCEGGPALLGQLHQLDLLDELFLTISPHLVGGADVGLLGNGAAVDHEWHLHRLLADDGLLLATYRR